MAKPLLTIFTPTYNRAHTLPRLVQSLREQTSFNFEWLVIDDGSTDGTKALVEKWIAEISDFKIRYHLVPNGGKNRAINMALKLASGQYFMILDSDDLLTNDAVQFICDKMCDIDELTDFIGISQKRANLKTGVPIGLSDVNYSEDGYVDCSNLERSQYGLERDMAEVFITDKLRKYEFFVWQNEKFAPEEIVWNQIALDGYKLRYYNKITYLCEYQEGGLSDSTWKLLRDNPMGYAMMFNQRLEINPSCSAQMRNAVLYGSCCLLAGEIRMLAKSKKPLLTMLILPIAWLVAQRRKKQFKTLIK